MIRKENTLHKWEGVSLLLFLFLSFTHYTQAQYTLKGSILDKQTRVPLPFATILFNSQERLGTIADIDGYFSLSLPQLPDSLTISYLGYHSQVLQIDKLSDSILNLEILLLQSNFSLSEVRIEAERNPALKIIQKVIENKDRNNPQKVSSFKCETYNKVLYDQYKPIVESQSAKEDSLLRARRIPDNMALFVMESVTELKYVYPDQVEETIKASKVAGFKKPSFAPIASEVQPFSFYAENILILDKYFLNPISNGSLKRYDFRLKDTIYQAEDTVYMITFKPKDGKNFEGLEGVLYINTFQYAIQNVLAHPFEQGPIEAHIEQKYIFLEGKQWFPHQLNFEVIAPHFPMENLGMQISGKSYIRNVELQADLDPKKFSFQQIHFEKNAYIQAPGYWVKQRVDSLNIKEQNTYGLIDSVGKKMNFDQKLRIIEKISSAKFPLGPLDLDLNKLYVFNEFEGHRLGIGLYTNEKIFKRASLGGFVAYGINDEIWKYGGSLEVELLPKYEWDLSLSFYNDVNQPGQSSLSLASGFTNPGSYIASRMDEIKQQGISTSWRMFRFLTTSISMNKYSRRPLYSYNFEPFNLDSTINATEIQLRFRYAFGEKIIETFGQNLVLESKYPVLELAYTKGINNFLNSELSYDKIELSLSHNWVSRQLGESSIYIQSGITNDYLPANWLFHGVGSNANDIWLLVPNTFQTMRPYEFLADKYIFAFWVQNIGTRLFRSKNFKPKLEFTQGIGWGTLSNSALHRGISFQSMNKGYLESGLIIRELIRVNLKIAYLGIGGGVYYRYGPYHLSNTLDNMAFKLAFGISYF